MPDLDDAFFVHDRWDELTDDQWLDLDSEDWAELFDWYADFPDILEELRELYEAAG